MPSPSHEQHGGGGVSSPSFQHRGKALKSKQTKTTLGPFSSVTAPQYTIRLNVKATYLSGFQREKASFHNAVFFLT